MAYRRFHCRFCDAEIEREVARPVECPSYLEEELTLEEETLICYRTYRRYSFWKFTEGSITFFNRNVGNAEDSLSVGEQALS